MYPITVFGNHAMIFTDTDTMARCPQLQQWHLYVVGNFSRQKIISITVASFSIDIKYNKYYIHIGPFEAKYSGT